MNAYDRTKNGQVHDLVSTARIDRAEHQNTLSSNPAASEWKLSGNQAYQRFAQSCPERLPSPGVCPFGGVCHSCPAQVQAKLKIGQPGDKYEREADQIADLVMRMPERQDDSEHRLNSVSPVASGLRRCSSCRAIGSEDDDEILQRKSKPGSSTLSVPNMHQRFNSLSGRGRQLPSSVRSFFEPRFRQDFSGVRIHSGSDANDLNRIIQAKAFTVGNEVVFGPSADSIDTFEGKRLLAHELAHVVQQNGSIPLRKCCVANDFNEQVISKIEKTGNDNIIQRMCAQHPLESWYRSNTSFCADTAFSGREHPNHRCYRQIPRSQNDTRGNCPRGWHVCFSRKTGQCDPDESHIDAIVPSITRASNGDCNLNYAGTCSLRHFQQDLVPSWGVELPEWVPQF